MKIFQNGGGGISTLEPNDLYQDRGVVKVTDGTYVTDITEDGELKVKDLKEDLSSTIGGQKTAFTQDIGSQMLLSDILKEMKKMNLYLSLMTDVSIKNAEVDI